MQESECFRETYLLMISGKLQHGEIIEEYPDDEPCLAVLFLGFSSGSPCYVVPNFINQALKAWTSRCTEMVRRRTRSIMCLINSIYRLMMSDYVEPVNIENPDEMSILEFPGRVIETLEVIQRLFLRSCLWMILRFGSRIYRG